jgi:hypothetical protein
MMKKVIIVGSWWLRENALKRKQWREKKWYKVLNYPKKLEWKNINQEYKKLFIDFFNDLNKSDIVFLMNEDKNWIEWYIWMGSFSEIGFATVQKVLNKKLIKIILLKMPSKENWCFEEIKIRRELWRINILDKSEF